MHLMHTTSTVSAAASNLRKRAGSELNRMLDSASKLQERSVDTLANIEKKKLHRELDRDEMLQEQHLVRQKEVKKARELKHEHLVKSGRANGLHYCDNVHCTSFGEVGKFALGQEQFTVCVYCGAIASPNISCELEFRVISGETNRNHASVVRSEHRNFELV